MPISALFRWRAMLRLPLRRHDMMPPGYALPRRQRHAADRAQEYALCAVTFIARQCTRYERHVMQQRRGEAQAQVPRSVRAAAARRRKARIQLCRTASESAQCRHAPVMLQERLSASKHDHTHCAAARAYAPARMRALDYASLRCAPAGALCSARPRHRCCLEQRHVCAVFIQRMRVKYGTRVIC